MRDATPKGMAINDKEVAAPQAIRVPPQVKEKEHVGAPIVLIFSFIGIALLGSLTVLLFL